MVPSDGMRSLRLSPILPILTRRAEVIVRFEDLPLQDLEHLLLESEAEGFRFVRRLRDDWISGANRFAGPGEAFFGCYLDGRLVAIGGVNRQSVSTGRLRRVYVARKARRTGVGRALVAHVITHAIQYFDEVVLRTNTEAADAFYRALGERVVGRPRLDPGFSQDTSARPYEKFVSLRARLA